MWSHQEQNWILLHLLLLFMFKELQSLNLHISVTFAVSCTRFWSHKHELFRNEQLWCWICSFWCLFVVISCANYVFLNFQVEGGELGGASKMFKYGSAIFLFFLWVLYIVLSSVKAYYPDDLPWWPHEDVLPEVCNEKNIYDLSSFIQSMSLLDAFYCRIDYMISYN